MLNADRLISRFDKALRIVTGIASATRQLPDFSELNNQSARERRHSAGLMRVNHVGEICAQALYEAQGHFTRSDQLREQFIQAGREEIDHLVWTAARLEELNSRQSILNPLWYAGAYTIGAIAAHAGDAWSLGFVVETERQVEAHLAKHLRILPEWDERSRAIVEQMRLDEVAHGNAAKAMGARELPVPVRFGMKSMAKAMTTIAYYI